MLGAPPLRFVTVSLTKCHCVLGRTKEPPVPPLPTDPSLPGKIAGKKPLNKSSVVLSLEWYYSSNYDIFMGRIVYNGVIRFHKDGKYFSLTYLPFFFTFSYSKPCFSKFPKKIVLMFKIKCITINFTFFSSSMIDKEFNFSNFKRTVWWRFQPPFFGSKDSAWAQYEQVKRFCKVFGFAIAFDCKVRNSPVYELNDYANTQF